MGVIIASLLISALSISISVANVTLVVRRNRRLNEQRRLRAEMENLRRHARDPL